MIHINGAPYSAEQVSKHFRCSECDASLIVDKDEDRYIIKCSDNPNHKGIDKMENTGIVTLTGLTMDQVTELFDEQLEDGAYKEVGGSGAGLTDIRPAWLTEYMGKAFGIAGYGWWFEYDPSENNVRIIDDAKKSSAQIKRLDIYYRLVIDGVTTVCGPVSSSGHSSNPSGSGDSMKGAITSAVGKAASKMGWQSSVYKNKRSHTKKHEDVKTQALSFKDLASLPGDMKKLAKLVNSDSELAVISQRLLLSMLNEESPFSGMEEELGKEVNDAVKGSIRKLFNAANADDISGMNTLAQVLVGKNMGDINYGEAVSLWDMLAMLANGQSSAESLGRAYKAVNSA